MSIIVNDKIVMKSSFEKFVEKCKKIFSLSHASKSDSTSRSNLVYIKTSAPWSTAFFSGKIGISGVCSSGSLKSEIQFSYKDSGGEVRGSVYNLDDEKIVSGYIFEDNDLVSLYLEFTNNVIALNVQSNIFDSEQEVRNYNRTESIEFVSVFPSSFSNIEHMTIGSTGIKNLDIKNVDDITTAEFSINTGSGIEAYSHGKQFDTIESASKLSTARQVSVSGAVTGSYTSDLSSNVSVELKLNKDDQDLLDVISSKVNILSIPVATNDTLGGIVLGGNITDSNKIPLKVDSQNQAYIDAFSVSGNFVKQVTELPEFSTSLEVGDIVQLVKSDSTSLTNGYFYRCESNAQDRTYKLVHSDPEQSSMEVILKESDASTDLAISGFKKLKKFFDETPDLPRNANGYKTIEFIYTSTSEFIFYGSVENPIKIMTSEEAIALFGERALNKGLRKLTSISDIEWEQVNVQPVVTELPEVTTADNGKILMVVNGKWVSAELPSYEQRFTDIESRLSALENV